MKHELFKYYFKEQFCYQNNVRNTVKLMTSNFRNILDFFFFLITFYYILLHFYCIRPFFKINIE
jgi:hypothetical protein